MEYLREELKKVVESRAQAEDAENQAKIPSTIEPSSLSPNVVLRSALRRSYAVDCRMSLFAREVDRHATLIFYV